MAAPTPHRIAFSLIELSIVLVILGLLTGGILAGKSLIRASELRSVISDVNRYKTAYMAFKDKYFALPGDMANATSFWGAIDNGDGQGSDCFTVASTAGKTCNGNGDNQINVPAGGTGNWNYGEYWHAWIHLADAGLVEGSYSGLPGPTGNAHAIPGTNIAASRISNAGYQFAWEGGWISSGVSAVANKNVIFFGKSRSDDGVTYTGAFGQTLSGEEAWNIDTKLDDGVMTTGKVIGMNSGIPPWCSYVSTSIGCGMAFLLE